MRAQSPHTDTCRDADQSGNDGCKERRGLDDNGVFHVFVGVILLAAGGTEFVWRSEMVAHVVLFLGHTARCCRFGSSWRRACCCFRCMRMHVRFGGVCQDEPATLQKTYKNVCFQCASSGCENVCFQCASSGCCNYHPPSRAASSVPWPLHNYASGSRYACVGSHPPVVTITPTLASGLLQVYASGYPYDTCTAVACSMRIAAEARGLANLHPCFCSRI